jgi:drug/metabolite transporter (DMT)-like permease
MSVLRRQEAISVVALLTVTASWGAAFVLMKDAIDRQPIPDFLFTRFAIAAAILILVRPQVLTRITPRVLWTGAVAGIILALGFITQTIGLELSTAAITGFLTGLYVVFTPLFAWLMLRQKLSGRVAVGATLAFIALGVLSITDFGFGPGSIWVIAGAVFLALHIVALGVWSPGADPYALTVVQVVAMAVVTGAWTVSDGNGYVAPPDAGVWIAVLFTAILATAFAYFVQTWVQGHMDSSRVAILLTTEVLWTGIIAVGVGQEPLTVRLLIGGAMMFVAMLIIEWPSRRRDGEPIT